ncbi:capsular polysaccharide export protein [Microbulbifer donghaiensis]|uniref:Capsular polysaccharide export protein n=1 Tax=Microbulbifer donghaiensis TaxID=494016 RepID=A0A1M5CJ46_9GAMM|nr:capsular biosynthesis protein [Microbulbifer donghaiensis]SHF54748.1 capsular polysaccharide export protein [Microbulbifer donghaiensis]
MASAVFLQGPHGPFFAKLAKRLSAFGVETHKINFNGGDRHFGWADFQVDFTGREQDWPAFFRAYLLEHSIRAVFVYGDCRQYHRAARAVCEELGISFGVFEEGYLRPDFVTLEWGGVNAYSSTDWSHNAIDSYQPRGRTPSLRVGMTFWQRAWYASRYYVAARLARSEFPAYRHHRNRDWKGEAVCWLKSFYRKGLYKITQRAVLPQLLQRFDRRFYLLPLQTRDDFQLRTHSDLLSIENTIDVVISSFARNAAADEALVIKHHPMDRGFCHYRKLIDALAAQHKVSGRVIYCHDLHLPTLLDHAKGLVTINSTVGISALLHRVPTKVLGRALYDMAGLTHQGDLDSFWRQPNAVDAKLFQRFRTYLYEHTQLDGNFCKHLNLTVDAAWQRLMHVVPVRQKVPVTAAVSVPGAAEIG